MKILIVLTAILSLVTIFTAKVFYERESGRSVLSNALATTSLCLYISHIVLKVATSFGYFTIPWFILLLAGLVFFASFDMEGWLDNSADFCLQAAVVLCVAGIAYMIATILFINNDIKTTLLSELDESETQAICISSDEPVYSEIIDGKLYLHIQQEDNSKCTIIVDLDEAKFPEDVTYVID